MDIVWHPALEEAVRDFLIAVDQAGEYDIITLIGLPRIGKSIVHGIVMRKLAGDPAKWDKGLLPMLYAAAAVTDRSYFSSKDFIARLLAEARAPRLSWLNTENGDADDPYETIKRDIEEARATWAQLSGNHDSSEPTMRRMLEGTARARRVKFISVGQAGSIAFTQRGRNPSEHMYSLMCLAEELPAKLLMSGTPRVHRLWEGNAEIRGRVVPVIFRRYKRESKEDMANATRLCISLTQHLKFDHHARPERTVGLVYATTLMATGLIREFYKRAENCRMADGAPKITLSHLKLAVMTELDIETLRKEQMLFDSLAQPMKISIPRRRSSPEPEKSTAQ